MLVKVEEMVVDKDEEDTLQEGVSRVDDRFLRA
jgi:hypothetical protein